MACTEMIIERFSTCGMPITISCSCRRGVPWTKYGILTNTGEEWGRGREDWAYSAGKVVSGIQEVHSKGKCFYNAAHAVCRLSGQI